MDDFCAIVDSSLKKRGFKKVSRTYCSTVNGLFFSVRLSENAKNKKVFVEISLLKDSYFSIYMQIHGIKNTDISDKDKLLGPYRIGLIPVFEELFFIDTDGKAQRYAEEAVSKIDHVVSENSVKDINSMITNGNYKPFYKVFALIDSGRIKEAVALSEDCVSKGDTGLYALNTGSTFYQDIINRYTSDTPCESKTIRHKAAIPLTESIVIDDIEWHYDSAEKKYCNKHNVPSELLSDSEMREITRLAGYHIGLFFHWLIDIGCACDFHMDNHSSGIKEILDNKCTGVDYLIENCGGKLTKEDICDNFADKLSDFYVKDGGYLSLYSDYLENHLHTNEYESFLSAKEFSDFEEFLNDHAPI